MKLLRANSPEDDTVLSIVGAAILMPILFLIMALTALPLVVGPPYFLYLMFTAAYH